MYLAGIKGILLFTCSIFFKYTCTLEPGSLVHKMFSAQIGEFLLSLICLPATTKFYLCHLQPTKIVFQE